MLKKLFALYVLLIVSAAAANASAEDDIAAAEYAKYGVNYADESLGERLSRLETDIFGMRQSGNVEERIANILRLNSNRGNIINTPVNSGYYNPYDVYKNTKRKGILRSLWDNLTGFNDNGFLTGFEPPLMNTISSSGYLNDLYGNRNNYNNYFNPPAFCPYHRNSVYDRSGYFNGTGIHPNTFANAYPPPFHHGMHRPRNTGVRNSYYIPPNVQTQSSIHILRD